MDSAMASGEFHVMSIQTPQEMAKMQAEGFNIFTYAAGTQCFMPDNNPDSHFADLRVRQAIEYAIDKNAIVKATGFGFNTVNNQLVNGPSACWNPNIVSKPYDTAKARQLITEAGYPNGFKTTLHTQPTYLQVTEIVQQFLAKVGINAVINNVDNLAYFQIVTNGWKDSMIVQDESFTPSLAGTMKRDFKPYGIMFVNVPLPSNVKELIDTALSATTRDAEIQANWALGKAVMDNESVIPLYSDSLGYIVSPRVHGGQWCLGLDWQAWQPSEVWMDP
jgi:peptide/nickel transport system substrate-binding protein